MNDFVGYLHEGTMRSYANIFRGMSQPLRDLSERLKSVFHCEVTAL